MIEIKGYPGYYLDDDGMTIIGKRNRALEAYKPFAVAMNEAQPAELEEITKKYADFPSMIKEFASIAKQADGGKDISDEWIQTTMKELGIPQL